MHIDENFAFIVCAENVKCIKHRNMQAPKK